MKIPEQFTTLITIAGGMRTMLALVMITSAGCTSPDTHTQGDTVAYYNRAVAELAKGDLEGAIADYTKAIELKPDEERGYGVRSLVERTKGDFDAAVLTSASGPQVKVPAGVGVDEL